MGNLLPFETFLTATEPVWVWNADTKSIVWANASARALWGDEDLAKLQQRRFPRGAPGFKTLSKIALKPNGSGEWSGPLTLSVADGKKALRCQVQPLELAGGAHGVIVKSLLEEDVPAENTHQPAKRQISADKPPAKKRSSKKPAAKASGANGSLAAAKAQPRQKAFRAKAADLAYLAGLSHDLRNPLTAIIGFADLMKSSGGRLTPETVANYADAISKSAAFALDLANDVMEYARSGRARPQAEAAPIAVAEIAAECLRLTAPLAERAGLEASLAVAPGLPALKIGERNLKQILLNVLLNSVKFSPPGSVIKLKAGLNKAGALVITIEDRGRQHADTAMRSVLQVGNDTAVPGAGLGLVMVKRLLKDVRGKMQRRKRSGGGTSTKLIFPEPCLA